VTLDDSVGLALLIVLQRLSPAERVVFVLHDIFQMPFQVIAETVGRAAPACRQLAVRARQKIAASGDGARLAIASAEHRLVTDKFIAACATGDLDGLLAVLAPDAWGEVDLGPDAGRGARGGDRGGKGRREPAALLGARRGACLGSRRRPVRGARLPRPEPGRGAGVQHAGQVIEAVHVIGDPAQAGPAAPAADCPWTGQLTCCTSRSAELSRPYLCPGHRSVTEGAQR
jgi:sigma-70-like protein